MTLVRATLPIRTTNAANGQHGHWRTRQKRAKGQRVTTHVLMALALPRPFPGPWAVTLTRVAPRALDAHDGLPNALKHVADGVADALGVKDNDPRVSWSYAQRRGGVREYAVEVTIAAGAP